MQALIAALQKLIIALQKYQKNMNTNLIENLAQGIYEAEGNGKQDGIVKGYNNPGDIRGKSGNKYLVGLGVTGYGYNNLAIFPTLESGQKAVIQLCTDVANNLMLAYSKPCTISEFAKIYGDPTTQQEWDDYVAILLKNIGNGKVATTTLTELL